MHARLIACALVGSVAAATTIPPDLTARADQLRKEASPQVLAWADEQARGLARSHGPVDVAALQAAARARFGKKQSASVGNAAPAGTTNWAVLGDMGNGDIEALAFLVLMQAAKSAQEDLKAIMDGVKAANAEKSKQRAAVTSIQRTTPTPTPATDRASVLLTAARELQDRTRGAQLSRVAPR